MSYSIDFRRRVIARVQSGNSKSAVCRMFGISRSTLHSWQNRADLSPRHNGLRNRKLNRKDFEQHVIDYPDALQRERAAHFKVSVSRPEKKTDALSRKRFHQPNQIPGKPEAKLDAAWPRSQSLS